MDADVLILSAGFGARLRPLTDSLPKPLIEVAGKRLIERNLELIARAGAKEVFINLHYLKEKIRDFVGDGSTWGLHVRFVEEPVILDTGGAIKNIEPWLQHEQLVTINADVIVGPDFNISDVLRRHVQNPEHPLITMVLRSDSKAVEYGELGVDAGGRVVSFSGHTYRPGLWRRGLMFSGIQVISRKVLEHMPPRGEVFSITRKTIRDILENQGIIASYEYLGYWTDVGTP